MSWSMPPTGQWGTGMGMTPDMNMGNYTPEQWSAMQQQNWQQWAQWQQQYATWQSQYGIKYAEQMQAMQAMGAMPPLPPTNTAPPPAPPPPDKPPPPPHENNQPLYGNTQKLPVPALAPGKNCTPSNSSIETTGNSQNRTQKTDSLDVNSVTSEALKTLAEEQKAFDIQFQQWEDEFDKWKQANMNHPDKKAYKEYEQTFEACKARLLERRLQMNQKKAKLMKNTSQASNNSAPRANVTSTTPPPVQNVKSGNYTNIEPTSYAHQNYNKNFSQNSQLNNMSQHYYKENNINNFQPQDRQETYSKSTSNNMNATNLPTEPFLPASEPPKGIPGLDLVPEIDKIANKRQDVIDITDEPMDQQFRSDQQGPDYSKISKGINNILGDETIMNILSLVRGQLPPTGQGPSPVQGMPSGHGPLSGPVLLSGHNSLLGQGPPLGQNSLLGQGPLLRQGSLLGLSPSSGHVSQQGLVNNQSSYGPSDFGNNYVGRNETYNDNYGTEQSYAKQGGDYGMHQDNNQASKYSAPQPRLYQSRPESAPQSQYNERNQQFKSHGLLPRPGMQQNVRHNVPMHSPLDSAQSQNDYTGGGFESRSRQEELHPQPNLGMRPTVPAVPPTPARPKWMEDPLFTPSIIVEYEHKPLRLKARDFIEPVHTFDYNHKSKDSDVKKKDFEKEAEQLFTRNPRISERESRYSSDRPSRDLYYRSSERTSNKEVRDFRDDSHIRTFREEFDDRRRFDDDRRRFDDDRRRFDDETDRRLEDRRRDDRDKYYRREDIHRERDREDVYRERERDLERIRAREREAERIKERDRERGSDHNKDRETYRDRNRDFRRSKSREKDHRKRGPSKDIDLDNTNSKKVKETPAPNNPNANPQHIIMIDDILELPGRQMRPEKIVIILRGPPGSGKSYLAKLIRDREAEQGGTVRVMSIDDYFMQEGEIEEKDPTTGKVVKKPSLQYEFDEKLEEAYLASLKRAFKRSLTDGYFTFLIYDAVNDQLRSYADIWNFSRQNGFQVYICTMDLDPQTCYKRNIHNRKLEDIEVICGRFFPTPHHHIQLDPTTLLQSASIPDVQMEDADNDVTMDDAQDSEVNSSFTSKWEKMDDAQQLARLDGTSRPLRPSQLSMEDYLQLDDWRPNASKPGKKTVRWADIEERRQQEKMRAIGFVVGQTDWNRMTDPTMGSGALTQTKYIERVRRS